MTHCVYKITNLINKKFYYGKTCNLQARWYGHMYAARHGSQFLIHRAMRKYGIENFEIQVVKEHASNNDASIHEKQLISSVNILTCYNIAKGGDGGHTMSQEQLNDQYSIGSDDYKIFLQLFHEGKTIKYLMKQFDASQNAIKSCASRLGISFAERRSQKKINHKPVKKIRKYISTRKMTDEQRYAFRSNLMSKLNKNRGVSDEIKQKIVDLYFIEQLSAKEIAVKLNITQGSIRSTVNLTYAKMDPEQRLTIKKQRASIVRSGDRNANSKLRKAYRIIP